MYFAISSWMLFVDLLSLDTGRNDGLAVLEAYCAQIGVSIGPLAEDGGEVFSLSRDLVGACAAYVDRSLLERFILPNIADRLVLDLLFFGFPLSGLPPSPPDFLPAAVSSLRFEGDEGGDCTLDCRSPSTFDLA